MKLNERQWVDLAYKKLKGAIYFDKTQLPLLDSIVRFERDGLEKELDDLAQLLAQPDDEKWEDFISDITSKIDVFVYPKKLEDYSNGQIIFNATDVPVKASPDREGRHSAPGCPSAAVAAQLRFALCRHGHHREEICRRVAAVPAGADVEAAGR